MARTTIRSEDITAGQIKSADLETNVVIDGDLTVDTDTLHIDSTNSRVGIGTSSPSKTLEVNGTGWIGDSSTAPTDANLQIHSDVAAGTVSFGDETSVVVSTNATGAGTQGYIGSLWFGSQDISDPDQYGWKLAGMAGHMSVDVGTSGGSAELLFYTASSSQTGTERMRISSNGTFTVGTTGLGTVGSTSGFQVNPQGHISSAVTSGRSIFSRMSTNGTAVELRRDTSVVGTISVTTTNTSYNTSSDYRLKENVQPLTGGIDRLKQLKPSHWTWIQSGEYGEGFVAHEAAIVAPEAVTGEKDAMRTEEYEVAPAVLNDEGVETTAAVMGTREVPEYQGIDQSKLVPLLTSALQEAVAKIESLEARVATLEAN